MAKVYLPFACYIDGYFFERGHYEKSDLPKVPKWAEGAGAAQEEPKEDPVDPDVGVTHSELNARSGATSFQEAMGRKPAPKKGSPQRKKAS